MSEAFSLILFVYGLAIAIALGAAVLIKAIVAALALSERRAAQTVPALPATPVPAPASVVPEAGIPAHHLVAIAAAAHAMIGAHRILHIGAATSGRIWSTEGRLAQHSSHHPSHH